MKSLAIVAPSNTMKNLPPMLRQYGEKQLMSMNFKVLYGNNVDRCFLNMAGTIKERALDLESALINSEIDGVMAVYGGYNSNQLLTEISYPLLTHKKFFVGYSDITALLMALSQKTTISCYHGPGFASFADPNFFDYTKQAFLNAISGKAFSLTDPGFYADDLWYMKKDYGPRELNKQLSWTTYQSGTVTAPILGGNLDTLCALAGTPYFPDFKDKILFLEDSVGDIGVFHRNMTQLEQIGVFNKIEGLIVGKFPSKSRLNNNDVLFSLLKDILKNRHFPVICHINCSHVDPMITIPLEKNCSLIAKNQPFLMLNQS
jgi:muramoyltetrapeptide carboxypeptidase LdcA involved in peptidoglycan recycling